MLAINPPKYRLLAPATLVMTALLFLISMGGYHEAEAGEFWDNLDGVEAAAKRENVDIHFHGKVVDQNGQPVDGAKVSFSVLAINENLINMSLQLGRENTPLRVKEAKEVYSDENGLFQVGGLRGTRGYVENIEKSGYLFRSKKYYTFSNNQPETLQQATAEQPAVFVLWMQGETQELLKSTVRMIVGPNEQSEPKTVHLIEFPDNPGFVKQGDFRIAVYNQGRGGDEKGFATRREYDWWVDIMAIDGGLLTTNDIWLYEAPADGYKQSLRIEEKSNDPDWQSGVRNKKIFFKSHGNYGNAIIKVTTDGTGRVGVFMTDIHINPTGSRNLEYDPSKEIKIKYQ